MFMCRQCKEQFEDGQLAYTLILESRVNFPASDMFLSKFCCQAHVQEFLDRISFQQQRYVLTKVSENGNKTYPPGSPLELLLMVGSPTVA